MNRPLALSLLAALATLAALPAPARAETVNCTQITALPATLTTQGVYCLKKDLATALTTGNAITIATNNVTIDCNGYKIGGLAGGIATEAIGIRAENRMNAVVRNCNLRGFAFAMFLQGGGHVVEDNRLDGNTKLGLVVFGDGSIVRGNRIFDTSGSPDPSLGFFGIYGMGNVDVIDNTVAGVVATPGSNQAGVGIYVHAATASAIDDNRVRDVVADGSGITYGIVSTDSGSLSLRGNQVIGSGIGTGLSCNTNQGIASGNHVLGFPTAVAICQDGGGNVSN